MSALSLTIVLLLLANSFILVWLVVRRGAPLKPGRVPSEMPAALETELAELIAKGRTLSVELRRISESVQCTQSSAEDVQVRFIRYVVAQSELARKHQAASDAMAQSLMELIDHADMALETASGRQEQQTLPHLQSESSVTLEQVRDMALDSLRRSGFRQMDVAAGQPFNSRSQRAIDRKTGPQPSDSILQVVRRGYLGGPRDAEYVVRSALVVVSDGPVRQSRSVAVEPGSDAKEHAKEERK